MTGNWFRDERIYFPKELLNQGANEVVIGFESRYVRDTMGMQYYFDKEDSEEYLYTDFETANAHLVFPCFDQPNMKAS
jgi:aminopeptidase N